MKWSRGSTLEGLFWDEGKTLREKSWTFTPVFNLWEKELYQEAKKYDVPYLEDESNESDDLEADIIIMSSHFKESLNAEATSKSAQMIADAVACLMPI